MNPSIKTITDSPESSTLQPSVESATATPQTADHLVEATSAISELQAKANAAREKAAQHMAARKYSDAKKSLDEAEKLEAEAAVAQKPAQAKAAREKAAQFMAEKRYAEAKQALEEADQLESQYTWKAAPRRALNAIRSKMPSRPAQPTIVSPNGAEVGSVSETDAVAESGRIVNLYSKIAAAAGLLPGGLLNFGAILAVQVVMVWRISQAFGHTEGRERVRGSILSLFGSIVPTGLGHGAGLAIAAIPAMIAGTVVYFVATPILAYAMTRAVGNVFIMHFESGGTLLTFDPKAFGEYFVNEFKKAGGSVQTAPAEATVTEPATV
jgi:uncharacterized protein (DUF697 family)